MASAAVIAAVKARIAANWTRAPLIDLNVQAETPPAGTAFLVVQYPTPSEQQISVGSPGSQVWRERGVIRLVLNVARGQDLTIYLGWMDELRAVFRGKKFSGVNTLAPSPSVQGDSNAAGNYWSLSSAVEFYFDLIG